MRHIRARFLRRKSSAHSPAIPATTPAAGLRRGQTRDAAGNLVAWNPSGSSFVNDQYNLCTGCHNLKTNDGKTMASGTAASGSVKVGHHENTWYRIIATTHNNNLDNETNGITGYVLRTNGETACFDCHGHEWRTETSNNPNATGFDPNKTTIFRDWSMSTTAVGCLRQSTTQQAPAPGQLSRSMRL